ncbi:TrmH family RNA methyltransferase [Halocola ammonii]
MHAQLYQYLSTFLTEGKKQHFENALQWRTRHISLVLDDIYNPQNISAILRSADCFGVQDVHIIENDHNFSVSKRVVKGANKWLSVYQYRDYHDNTAPCLDGLKARGYKIAATSLHTEAIFPKDLPLNEPIAVVLGAEKDGVSQSTLDKADYHLKIPMYGFTESYNVSVASALILQTLRERLNQSKEIDWKLGAEEADELRIEWAKKCLRNPQEIIRNYHGNS